MQIIIQPTNIFLNTGVTNVFYFEEMASIYKVARLLSFLLLGYKLMLRGCSRRRRETRKKNLFGMINLYYAGTGSASSRASTPGSSLPSSNSKLAPPPVDMWLIDSATPTFSTAATESPPPIIVVTPFLLSSSSFLAIAYVS